MCSFSKNMLRFQSGESSQKQQLAPAFSESYLLLLIVHVNSSRHVFYIFSAESSMFGLGYCICHRSSIGVISHLVEVITTVIPQDGIQHIQNGISHDIIITLTYLNFPLLFSAIVIPPGPPYRMVSPSSSYVHLRSPRRSQGIDTSACASSGLKPNLHPWSRAWESRYFLSLLGGFIFIFFQNIWDNPSH